MVYFGIVWSTSMQNFKLLASKMTELWLIKNFDFEVEVKAEAKIEVGYIYGLNKSTSMLNFRLVVLKMTELWLFKFFDLRGRGRG